MGFSFLESSHFFKISGYRITCTSLNIWKFLSKDCNTYLAILYLPLLFCQPISFWLKINSFSHFLYLPKDENVSEVNWYLRLYFHLNMTKISSRYPNSLPFSSLLLMNVMSLWNAVSEVIILCLKWLGGLSSFIHTELLIEYLLCVRNYSGPCSFFLPPLNLAEWVSSVMFLDTHTSGLPYNVWIPALWQQLIFLLFLLSQKFCHRLNPLPPFFFCLTAD